MSNQIACNGCGKMIDGWRQWSGVCKLNIGYCKECGGDNRAVKEMAEHIKGHEAKGNELTPEKITDLLKSAVPGAEELDESLKKIITRP